MHSITGDHGLIVVCADASEKDVDRALKRLDPGLFLDRELDYWGRIVYVVKHRVGSETLPFPVLSWVDDDDTPRPCSMGIVDQVRRQETRSRADEMSGKRLAESARRVRDKLRDDTMQHGLDVLREHERTLKPGHGKPVTISTPLSERTG